MKLILQKVIAMEAYPAYAVMDFHGRTVGYLVSKKKKDEKKWGFTYVESQLKQLVNHCYNSKLEALDALIICRDLDKNKTKVTEVIKSPLSL